MAPGHIKFDLLPNDGNEDIKMTSTKNRNSVDEYTDLVNYIERLHRLLLDMLKVELETAGHTELNNVQALLLYNIGDAEMTAGELRSRGHYLGSNVSYNLKKLVEAGFINHERSASDKRSVRVSLTNSGQAIRKLVQSMYTRQGILLRDLGTLNELDTQSLNHALMGLEGFWQTQIRHRQT